MLYSLLNNMRVKNLHHLESHNDGIGNYIKDIIYAANDGIITTFAVVAGVAGASLSLNSIIILGFANLFADGFSMALSNYLGSRSERALIKKEKNREEKEVTNMPDKEAREVLDILCDRGYERGDAEILTSLIRKNEKFWVDFMMKYELRLPEGRASDIKASGLTFGSFVVAGSLPLLPFIFFSATQGNLPFISGMTTAATLFTVGALRCTVTKKNWFTSGLEMLIVGGIAGAIAYFIGYGISIFI